jgi:hypothetical protein
LIAAAALQERLGDAELRARVVKLAEGASPHPDLEVRVECARVALGAGSDEVVPFLLRVLRVMTPDEALDPPDWQPVTTLYWAKHRAAQALSLRAAVTIEFLPDASYEDQASQAARLEQALVACGALPSPVSPD